MSRTVLLVEDDDTSRKALGDLLREHGYDAVTAGNGREALDYLRTHPAPAVILLDLMLPVMDGWQFRSEQLKDPSLANIPVVILTAAHDERERASYLNAAAYLTKPFRFDALLNVVAQQTDAVLRAEARHAAILEAAVDAIVTTDERGIVVEWNSAAEAMFGYLRRDALGKTVAELIVPPEMRARDEAGFARYMDTGKGALIGRRVETTALRADGSEFPVELAVTRVPVSGPILFTATIRDISERRDAEAALRETETQLVAARKLEAVAQLAGGIAHQFNNLLQVISGYSDLALQGGAADPALPQHLEAIRAAAGRATALTAQILAFGRQQIIRPQRLDFNAFVARTAARLRPHLSARVELSIEPGSGVQPVRVDPEQMEQVIQELIVNARDAMPQGGRIVIATDDVTLDDAYCKQHPDAAPGRYARLTVRDTGRGIDPAIMDRILEPFFTTKPIGEGTGLGLSAVYGMVRQSGGHLEVASEAGSGAVFSVYLPVAAEPTAVLGSPGGANGQATILVVEDEPFVLRFAAQVLRLRGYQVLEAADAEEALQLAHRHAGNIDLLLTDVVMHGLYGPALAERLASERPGLRVLYTSATTSYALVREGELPPSMPFLQKPFSPDSLIRKIEELLE